MTYYKLHRFKRYQSITPVGKGGRGSEQKSSCWGGKEELCPKKIKHWPTHTWEKLKSFHKHIFGGLKFLQNSVVCGPKRNKHYLIMAMANAILSNLSFNFTYNFVVSLVSINFIFDKFQQLGLILWKFSS